jgi:hypothetical protein
VYRTSLGELLRAGLITVDPAHRNKDSIVVSFAPIVYSEGPARFLTPAAPVMELLGPHVTTMDILRHEIRQLPAVFQLEAFDAPDDDQPL